MISKKPLLNISYQGVVLLFLLSYFLIGVSARLTMRYEEQFYLIYSWYLYSKVPPPLQNEFSVLIYKIADERFSPPLFIDDTKGLVFSRMIDYGHTIVHDVEALGKAVSSGQKMNVGRARESLEKNFLHLPVVYEVVRISFNPIDRWKTGNLLQINSLAIFTSGIHE